VKAVFLLAWDWYNFPVPTPFYHLSLAEDLLHHSLLPEEVRQFLHTYRCEFLFGNTAPDVQVVSGQPRQQTHFFDLPIQAGDPPAWELFLSYHPSLADAKQLPGNQVAFVAGYLCHLQADWFWVKDIFAPNFGPRCAWGTFDQRLYLHNVLRAYLDVRILPKLSPGMDVCLRQVEPDGWLPFVKDYHLSKWRDFLFPQLQPGASPQTVEVFSSRLGISTPEFYALLGSMERMQKEVFEHLPLEQVKYYHQWILDQNIQLISNYLATILQEVISPINIKGVQL
jgi:hypothetical protein